MCITGVGQKQNQKWSQIQILNKASGPYLARFSGPFFRTFRSVPFANCLKTN